MTYKDIDYKYNFKNIDKIIILDKAYGKSSKIDLLRDFIIRMQKFDSMYSLDRYLFRNKKIVSKVPNDVKYDTFEWDGDEIISSDFSYVAPMVMYNYYLNVNFSFGQICELIYELCIEYEYDTSKIEFTPLTEEEIPIILNDAYVNIKDLKMMTGTKPYALKIGENEYNVSFWSTVLITLANYFIDNYPDKDIEGFNEYFKTPYIRKSDILLNKGLVLSNGKYMETCFSSNRCILIINKLVDFYDYKDFVGVKYTVKGEQQPGLDIVIEENKSFSEDDVEHVLEAMLDFDSGVSLDYIDLSNLNDVLKAKGYEELDQDILGRILKENCLCKENIYFHRDVLISPSVREKVKKYLDEEVFGQGFTVAHGEALYSKYGLDFINIGKDNLVRYLSMYDGFYKDGCYLVKEEGAKADDIGDLLKILETKGEPKKCEEINHPCMTLDRIRYVLDQHKNSKVVFNGQDEYVHPNVFWDDIELKNTFKTLVDRELNDNHKLFITRKEIVDMLSWEYEDLYKNYDFLSPNGYKNMLKYLLSNDYEFENEKIFTKGSEKQDYYKVYLEARPEASLSQLKEYLEENRIRYDLKKVLKYKMRVDEDKLIDIDKVEFNIEETDKELERILEDKDYCTLKNVELSRLPKVKINGIENIFNIYLLEAYIEKYSRFKRIKPNHYGLDVVGCYCVESIDYDNIVIDVLVNAAIIDKEKAKNFLIEKGYFLNLSYYPKFDNIIVEVNTRLGNKNV